MEPVGTTPPSAPVPKSTSGGTGSGRRESTSSPLAQRYRTLYPLGRGGMGTVELALERPSPPALPDGEIPAPAPSDRNVAFERIVALKRLLPDAKARHAEMFLREAKVAVLLDHPNVVHAYDFGELGGELFIAMEYVEGEPLSRVLSMAREKQLVLPPALAARVVADVCEGLHAAHDLVDENGTPLRVVHRDVSPHNVMVAYDGQVKLLDFGVAKIEDEHGLTRTGEVKGKAAYMSPEQAMGDPLDRRSDLYAVGAVLFECLVGRRMWEGTDMEVMRKLALHTPPKLEELVPEVSPALARLYERLVSRSPGERPASAADVARELREIAGPAAPTQEELASLMLTLFEESARTRRTELDRALAEVDPSKISDIRKSLEPGGSTRSSSAPTRLSVAPNTAARPRSRRNFWIGVAAVAVLAAAGAVTRLQANDRPPLRPTPSASPRHDRTDDLSPSPAASTATEQLPMDVAPQGAGSTAASTASAASARSASVATPSSPVKARPSTSAPKPDAKPAKSASPPPPTAPIPSSKPLDVDPHAI